MVYLAAGLAVLASLLYHISQKSIPTTANPILSLIVAYGIALIISTILFAFFPTKLTILESLKQLNWASFVVALAIVGIEMGFLLA